METAKRIKVTLIFSLLQKGKARGLKNIDWVLVKPNLITEEGVS